MTTYGDLAIKNIEDSWAQKRQEARVAVDLDISVNVILDGERELNLPKSVSAKIINLSGGGVLLSSDISIPDNIAFCLNLDFAPDNFLIAQIVRKTKNGDSYHYGCKFLSLSDSEKQKIRKYVFFIQLKLKNQKKDYTSTLLE